MEYSANDFRYYSSLSHHGILGMKWGVRRYQNEDGTLTDAGKKRYSQTAKGLQNRMNDVDTAIARNKRHLAEDTAKMNKYVKKASKTKNDDKRSSIYDKVGHYAEKVINWQKNIEKGQKEIDWILENAGPAGYKITSKPTKRNVAEGRDAVAAIFKTFALNALLMPTVGVGGFTTTTYTIQGTKYKVEDLWRDKK